MGCEDLKTKHVDIVVYTHSRPPAFTAEQRYHEVESKYVAARKDANDARNELEQLKKEHQSAKQREGTANATITTLKEEKSLFESQLAEAKKQARQATEQSDAAEKKCLQIMHELDQAKRTLLLSFSI